VSAGFHFHCITCFYYNVLPRFHADALRRFHVDVLLVQLDDCFIGVFHLNDGVFTVEVNVVPQRIGDRNTSGLSVDLNGVCGIFAVLRRCLHGDAAFVRRHLDMVAVVR